MTVNAASHIYFSQRLRLHYVDWGNADAPNMVMVHGMQDHCRTWDALVEEFVDDYHIVAPDLRGHGDSEWVKGAAYDYRDYVYDLHQLVDQAQLAPITLIGHSLGGAIAALFAGVYPEMVSRLIVVEGIGLWRAAQPQPPAAARIREWVSEVRRLSGRLPRRYDTLSDAYHRMQQANPQLSQEQALHLTTHGSNQNEDGSFSWKYDNYIHNFSSTSMTEEDIVSLWERITCPVLLVNADHGLEHRIGQDGSDAYFGDVRVRDVSGAGHWTYHDRHEEVVGYVREFVSSIG